jgi:hypothetical protein
MEGYRLLMATAAHDFCPPADFDYNIFTPLHVILGNDHPDGDQESGVSRVLCDVLCVRFDIL